MDWNLAKSVGLGDQYKLNWFVNGAFTSSEYIESEENNVKGRKVEFIPKVNLKTGINTGYKNFQCF